MKYKVGDQVRIKSLDWYNKNKDVYGRIKCGSQSFIEDMSKYCGQVATITKMFKNEYHLDIGYWSWTEDMFEEIMEDEISFDTEYEWKHEFNCPDGYQFVDENGNVINTTKIVLEKKKDEYPLTYDECYKIIVEMTGGDCNPKGVMGYKARILESLQKLLVCRDAYWKIAGEEMGLGKAWEPDWLDDDTKKCVITSSKVFETFGGLGYINYILTFPTEEMRDAFKENFDKDLEFCKELL